MFSGMFIFMDSSKAKPFDKAILRLKTSKDSDSVFFPGDGVCFMRFYYKMWGSRHLGRLQLFMVTTPGGNVVTNEIWKTRGKGIMQIFK